MIRLETVAAIAISSLLAVAPAAAQSSTAPVGTLDCDISGGIGFIIGSKKTVTCYFAPSRGEREVYVGSIDKFGLDIGATARGRMVWTVFAPSGRAHFSLAGNYVGASAEASVGAGGGANVLVGGSDRTISLQPLSVQAQTGVNFAAGVTSLQLHPAARN